MAMRMTGTLRPDVFTLDELARAVGVPRAIVAGRIASGALRTTGHGFVSLADAVSAAGPLRTAAALAVPEPVERTLPDEDAATRRPSRPNRVPLLVSSLVHATALGVVLSLGAASPGVPSAPEPIEPTRLVFLVTPGPGGGGGGSGARTRTPATRLQRQGTDRGERSVPRAQPDPVLTQVRDDTVRPAVAAAPSPIDEAPEPLPSTSVIAPVVVTTVARREAPGVVDAPPAAAPSRGPGAGNNAGAGQGGGHGAGTGSGIGEGAGGGTGGGPYRPGSGVQPPRLLREVKASYTDEARRQGVRGEVLLEIVVLSDGRVGDVTVLRGLPAGLDARAVEAVRQWRFAPAMRGGTAVDVVVQVAVEFTLR